MPEFYNRFEGRNDLFDYAKVNGIYVKYFLSIRPLLFDYLP